MVRGPAATFARRVGPAVLAGVALGGCVCGHLRSRDQLSLDAIEPSVAIAGVRTPLLIRGNGFRPGVVTDVDGKTATADSLSLRIGPAEIADPVLRADGAIEAVVPDTLAPGVYEVSISLGQRGVGGMALQIVAPIEVTLHAPADLASGEQKPFSLQVVSRAPSDVMLSIERIGVFPNGPAIASGLVLPVLVGPQYPVEVFGTLTSERPGAEADAALAVSVHWSLGPLSGTVDESASLRALGVPEMTATIDAPAEIEVGDQRPLSARLWAPAAVDLAHVNFAVTAGGSASLASNVSISGATIGAGDSLSLGGSVQGVSAGPGWLQLDATSVAQRGDSPAPLSQRYALAIRKGPAPALSVPSLPAIVEVGVPVTVAIDARNDGDVDLANGQLTVSATDGSVSNPASSLAIAAGAHVQRTISVTPQTAGAPVRLTVALSGVSALSGRAFSAQPASASSGAARRPAALAITASPSQSPASKGQKVPLSVLITNTGDVDVPAAVLSIAAGGSGLVIGPSGAPASSAQLPPTSVPAGGSVSLSPVTVGNWPAPATFSLTVSGNDSVSGAQVSASAAARYDVQAGPLLSVSVSGPPRIVSGQSATLNVLVRNAGDVDALSVTVGAQVSGGVSAGSPSPASAARLAAGGSLSFSIPVQAGGPAGGASVIVTASAQDGNGAGAVSASSAFGLLVHDPPRITASFTGSLPATATEGQVLATTLHLSAAGPPSADASLVALPSLATSGSGTVTAQAPCPLPCALPAGGTLDIPVRIAAGTAGNLQVTATFPQALVDADQGAPLNVAATSTSAVQVQTAGALAIQIGAPQLVEGFRSQLTVDVSNTGGAEIAGLGLVALDLTDASGAAVTPNSISAVPPGPLAGGARESFTFDVTPATGAGTLTVHVRLTGTETNTSAQRVGDATSAPFAVLRPGGLIANLAGVPAKASVGQTLTAQVQLTNSGQTAVNGVIASLSPRNSPGDGTLTISGPSQAAQSLAPGTSATFTFQVTVNSAGPAALTGSGSGTVQGGGAAAVSPSAASLVLQAPAKLTATLTTDRTRVSVGQKLQLTLAVQNTGQADATNISPTAPTTAAGTTATLDVITPTSPGTVAVLHAGQSVSFIWTTSATSAGQVAFVTGAQGTDGNDPSMTPSTGSITSATVEAQSPGVLAISAVAGPARISAGLQRPSLTLTATNSGGADIVLSDLPPPVAVTTASAAVAIASQPASAAGIVLHSGASRDFTWTFDARASGTVSWRASASATESNTGATLTPAAASTAAIAIDAPAALALSLAASPSRLSAGLQRVQLALTVTNTGGASLRLDPLPAPTLRTTGSAGATLASSPPPAGGTILAGGASQTFSWQYDASGSGTLAFAATASGTDGNSGTPVSPPAATAPVVEVQAPGALAATATASPGQVSAGLQQVSLVLTLQNTGGAAVRLDALPAPTVTPGGSAAAALSSSPPSPAGDLLAGGATRTFTWVWNVSGSGTLAFSCSASGTDANAGAAVPAVTAASQPVTVQAPGALSVSSSVSPASASAGQNPVSFTLVIRNTGGADVRLDALAAPVIAVTGSAGATIASAPASAAGTVLAGGGSASFTWKYDVSGSGTVSFTGSASGVEANTQGALKPAPVTSSPVSVQRPGQLSIAASASPAQVSAGLQQVALSLVLQNTGEADVILDSVPQPTVTSTGSASANGASSPPAAAGTVLPGGSSKSLTWTWNMGGEGTVSFTASATGHDGNSGSAIAPAPAPAGPVTVQTSGALSLSIAVAPTQVSAGLQQVTLTLSATNTGGASVILDALAQPTVTAGGGAAAALLTSPASPAGSVLPGGSTRSFVWTWTVSGTGTLSFTARATGKESNSGNTIAPVPVTSSTVVVQAPAALTLSATATPAKVSAGLQRVSLALAVSNPGGAAVRLDALPPPTVATTGTAAATLASAPASPAGTLLAGGATTTFTWQYDVAGSGTLSLSASASGTDANSGTALAPAPVAATAVTVQQPAGLTLSASLSPATLSAGLQQLSLVLQAKNPGEAGAVLAALPAPSIVTTGSASASAVSSPPSSAGTVLAGGATRSFTWTYSVAGSGSLSFTASASGTDANSATPLTPPAAPAGSATIQRPANLTIASVVASPSLAHLGDAIDVAVAVRNDGEASAVNVQLSGLSASTTATQSGSPSGAQTIPGGGSAMFHIPFVAQSEGSFTATSGATGSDVNAGSSLTASSVTSAPIDITAIQVAITFPDNRATLQAGATLKAIANAWNTAGASVTQLSLSATGPATIAAPSSISGSRQTVGGTFSVSANSNAAAGSIITLVARATDAAGPIVSSTPVTVTVGPPGVLSLRCRPQPQLNVAIGQSGEARLEAQLSDGSFEDATLSAAWSSSATAIATVSAGIVRGVAAGDAVVNSTFSGLSTTCPVHVAPSAPSYAIRPPDPILLGLGGKLQLQFLQSGTSTHPSDLTGTATWTSSATAVASVASGLVTGVSAGTATITACVATNCASTLAVVGNDLDTGSFSYQRYAIGNSQKFNSLRLRQGTVTYLAYDAVGLTLNVGSFRIDSGASLIGDGRNAPGAVSDGSITANGEGGDGAPGAGGGGAGSGNGSSFCGGNNCGGGGASSGANAGGCLLSTCAGGAGAAGSAGGAGAPGGLLILSPPPGDAGGGGGDGGKGGRGGGYGGGFASAGGATGVLDGKTGGNGGGGGNASSSSGPGGGGGGGGGAILFSGNPSASIRIDGLISLEGGGGGMLRSANNAGPGGAGAGGSFFIDATSGSVTGVGTISVRGGAGGSGSASGACGGGGGGGGGIVQISAPVAGPDLVTFIEGGPGGAPCGGGGQGGEAGSPGVLKRP
jgi:hypothetical protein